MTDKAIAALVERLETVTKRLESVEARLGSGGGSSSGGASAGGSGGSSGNDDATTVVEFDTLVREHLSKYLEASKSIGGETAEIAALFNEATTQLRNVILGATAAKKPDQSGMMAFVKPLSDAMQAVVEYRNAHRGSKEWDHLSTVSEGVASFGWVCIEPTPGPFAMQTRAGAEFYSNKLLRLYKDKDETQMAWISGFTGFLKGMEEYIKNHHRTGLQFSGTGVAKAASGGAPAAKGPGGPPPPMPKAPLVSKDELAKAGGGAAAASGGGDRGGLFAQINQGGKITSGLKKVTKDMQTHKNKELRAGGVVKADAMKKNAPSKHRGIPTGTARGPVLDGNKWVCEYIVDGGTLDIEPDMKHSVYIYGCVNTVFNCKTKVNQVQMDSSKKVSFVGTDVLATVDVVNCNSCQVQVLGKSPTIAVEKTSGMNIFLSKDCLAVEIITAKSDSVNVAVPQADGDFAEFPIPEQFKSVIKDGKVVTSEVEHGD